MYSEFINYLVASRKSAAKMFKKAEMNAEQKAEALEVFDLMAEKALEHHMAYGLLKQAAIQIIGKQKWDEIEFKSAENFLRIEVAKRAYQREISANHKLGRIGLGD